MQAKINRGLTTVHEEYEAALKELVGPHRGDFEKLHGLFVKDFLPKEHSSGSYFL
jgi:hypothetical protein